MIEIPIAFRELFKPYRFKSFFGGRGGAKSYTFAQTLLIKAANEKHKILCTREYQTSIKNSVKSTLDTMIKKMNLEFFYKSGRDTIEGKNGSIFIFNGIKLNPMEIKSLDGVTICWAEESQRISQESMDILIPTIREENSEIWFSWNPYLKTDPVYKMFVTEGRPNSLIKKVSYLDNPFVSQTLLAEMEYDKKHNPEKYMHIWEGNPLTISEAVVFKDKFKIENFETPKGVTFYLGLDLGFSVDPMAFIRCYIDHANRKIFIDKGLSAVGVEIEDTASFLTGVIKDCKSWMITADRSRPEIISHLRNKNFRIQGSKSGPGSVLEGVEFIKSYSVIIHESLKDVINEFSLYSYKVDKHTGNILPLLEDKNNHFIDALRYATEGLRGPQASMSL